MTSRHAKTPSRSRLQTLWMVDATVAAVTVILAVIRAATGAAALDPLGVTAFLVLFLLGVITVVALVVVGVRRLRVRHRIAMNYVRNL